MGKEGKTLKYTEENSEQLLENLKDMFSVARILKEKEVAGFCEKEGHHCYEFWGKGKPCENCTSYKTLHDHQERIKFEYLDGKPYQIISKYASVDGKDSVIEMLTKIDNVMISPTDARVLSVEILRINDELYKDVLTGALNRVYYEDNKDMMLLNAGVAFVDVDNFKSVNDGYGHKFGDEVLKSIVSTFRMYTRDTDAVIRYGGDEFVLLIPNISKESFEERLNDIRRAVVHTSQHLGIPFSVSIGGLICKQRSFESAVTEADKIMYEAKQKKNTVIVLGDTNE